MSGHIQRRKRLGIFPMLVLGCLALALAFGLVGCGSNTSQSTVTTGAATTVPIGAVGPAPLLTLPYLTVTNSRLNQTQVEVQAGGAVVFRNGEDDSPIQYRFVADDGSFDTGILGSEAEFVVHFPKAGTFAFHEQSNPNIKGTVVVTTTVTAPELGVLPPAGPVVRIKAGRLNVTDVQVRVGEAITFANTEDDNTLQHQLVADDGSFDTGVLRPNQQYSFTFQQAGTYAFHDTMDSSIKGTITVK